MEQQQQQQAKNESAKVLLDSLNNNNYLPGKSFDDSSGKRGFKTFVNEIIIAFTLWASRTDGFFGSNGDI